MTNSQLSCLILSIDISKTKLQLYFFHPSKDDTIEMRASQAIFVEQLHLDPLSVNLNDDITLDVTLTSNFPEAMTFDTIKVGSCILCLLSYLFGG